MYFIRLKWQENARIVVRDKRQAVYIMSVMNTYVFKYRVKRRKNVHTQKERVGGSGRDT